VQDFIQNELLEFPGVGGTVLHSEPLAGASLAYPLVQAGESEKSLQSFVAVPVADGRKSGRGSRIAGGLADRLVIDSLHAL
jgi:hypothetical protein